jgi:hypothetical protein
LAKFSFELGKRYYLVVDVDEEVARKDLIVFFKITRFLRLIFWPLILHSHADIVLILQGALKRKSRVFTVFETVCLHLFLRKAYAV